MTSPDPEPGFAALVDYLYRSRGFDVSGYKRATLGRRLQKRLDAVGISDLREYRDYLEVHAEEFDLLFNTILINVTSFLRDPEAWDRLAKQVLPAILAATPGDQPIRAWSAGCASGEEAYTLAMLLAETVGEADFQRRVKIYCTDIDEEALAQARSGAYPAAALEAVPPGLRARHFEPKGSRWAFRPELRRVMVFGRHDLTHDAPISRLDLVVCRNTLMYFNAEAQAGIVRRLAFGLKPGGHLFLGRAESLLAFTDLFEPVSATHRLFRRTAVADAHRAPATRAFPAGASQPVPRADDTSRLALTHLPVPYLVIDSAGTLVETNAAAREVLGMASTDLGRPFQDLEISYRPTDLRTPIELAKAERRSVDLHAVPGPVHAASARFYDILVRPMGPPRRPPTAVGLTFLDVTRVNELQSELKRTAEELETAYEELQSSGEELETTNEELQSTVEELETTNEELHSTNEELETTNEELRSTNDELVVLNAELNVRTEEARDVTSYLSSILNGVTLGVVVVDDALVVRTWNRVAEDLWGLRADEVVGTSLTAVDSGLPVRRLLAPLESVTGRDSTETSELQVAAVDRRGRTVQLRVRLSALHGGDRRGVVMLMEVTPRESLA